MNQSVCDVAVCGGGMAGLTLAYHLRRELPERSVVVLDRLAQPLPEAAFKVGEATVEVGAFYLAQILGLENYLDRHHLIKHGLRFFFGSGWAPIEVRPEFGLSGDPPVKSYLIDRGRFENDLRGQIVSAGVDLREGCKIRKLNLAQGSDSHEILYLDRHDQQRRLQARWIIDATGRRRLLQRELHLEVVGRARCSAAWFRVDKRFGVRELVPLTSEAWHRRVATKNRDFSVAHLVGQGYWVWIIPLSSGATSVGIVAEEAHHDFADFNTPDRALQWLRLHEPVVAEYVRKHNWLDFKVMRRYSYTAQRVFSENRWACVGEAAVFADPLNSPGVDSIGFANCMVVDMIRRDFAGILDPKDVNRYDRFLCGLNDLITYQFQIDYGIFGNLMAATAKVIWTIASAWTIYSPQMFNLTFLDREKMEGFRQATMGFFFLTRRMHVLFRDWGRLPPGRGRYEFINYISIPILKDLSRRNLRSGKDLEELVEDQRWNMERLEELAQVLFLLAIEDLMPDQLERFHDPVWINAWKVGLDPELWEGDGLFEPKTQRRDLAPIRDQIQRLFLFNDRPGVIPDLFVTT